MKRILAIALLMGMFNLAEAQTQTREVTPVSILKSAMTLQMKAEKHSLKVQAEILRKAVNELMKAGI